MIQNNKIRIKKMMTMKMKTVKDSCLIKKLIKNYYKIIKKKYKIKIKSKLMIN